MRRGINKVILIGNLGQDPESALPAKRRCCHQHHLGHFRDLARQTDQ